VCEPEGIGAAVLIRALEPLEGVGEMVARRRLTREEDLCSGPGKLTQALGIDLEHNQERLDTGRVRILARAPGQPVPAHVAGPRIGITKAAELPWRFSVAGNRHVSRPRPKLAA
jgi:DNA-3-methyladenine glycosylase